MMAAISWILSGKSSEACPTTALACTPDMSYTKSTKKPMAREHTAIMDRYMTSVRVLKMFLTMLMVAALVAGPASKNTSAAPGFRPLSIKAAAMGVEDVAQTYMGIPVISMTSMDKNL